MKNDEIVISPIRKTVRRDNPFTKFTTALLSAKMGVFRTKFVTENVEQHREKGEREGEAQNTTLHAKFSKKPSMFRQRMYRFSRAKLLRTAFQTLRGIG